MSTSRQLWARYEPVHDLIYFSPRRARRLATLMLSTLEGAIMLARVHRDVRPLTTVATELGPLLDEAHRA